jgi:hypothetical protein
MHAAAKAGQPAAHSVEECRGESTLRSSRTQRILITSIAIARAYEAEYAGDVQRGDDG